MPQNYLEKAILAEARSVCGRPKLKMKQIIAWRYCKLFHFAGESVYYLPKLKIYIAVKKGT